MNKLVADARLAMRSLIGQPAHSVVTISVLSAGLACVIFMMALFNGFVLRQLPFAQPEELVQAGLYTDDWGPDYLQPVLAKDLTEIRRQLSASGQVAGYSRTTMNISAIDIPERGYGALVTANLFSLLGIDPVLGRNFTHADEEYGAPDVVILSYDLWKGRYGGDRSILGRQVRINAKPITVIGVMPPNFSFPIKEDVWMAAHLPNGKEADETPYDLVVRRNGTASESAIVGSLESWLQQAAHEEPERFRGKHIGIGDLRNITWGGALRQPLYVMFAAVTLLLLIACANAANLMLARTLGRREEIAVRIALGATHARLMSFLLMESVILSVTAAALSLLLAAIGVNWLVSWFRVNDFGPAHWQRFDIDATVLAFAASTALFVALATGVPAAWRTIRDVGVAGLRGASPGVVNGGTRLNGMLVVGQVTLSCALLISVSMMVQQIASIDRTDIGIKTDHLLSSRIVLSSSAYPTADTRLRLFDRLAERMRSESGVMNVSIGTAVPGTYWNRIQGVLPVGAAPDQSAIPRTATGAVDDQFLQTFGITLQEGRFFNGGDTADHPPVAVVDRRFVEKFSPDHSVVGRQYHLDPRNPAGSTVTIVGVIGNIMLNTQQQPVQTTLLLPSSQAPFQTGSVTVRTSEDSVALATHLNKVMRDVDADIPLAFRDYNSIPRGQTKTAHTFAVAFDVLGVVALVLVGVGLYGVLVVGVRRRTREIGIRRALGAPDRKIYASLFGRSSIHVTVGLILGIASGVPFARYLDDSLLSFGNSAHPRVLLSAVIVIMLAMFFAVVVPARRATKIDPNQTLRFE